ncbi:MAG: hypothetical protein EXS13_08005 [Planctomycetes bacterium]|nr:hypothetical protein [Planctomycetota bacterium]
MAASVAAWLAAGCSVPSIETPPNALPELLVAAADGETVLYDTYTGDESTAGDYFVRVETWCNADGTRRVTLLPMVHVADADFYAQVERRLADADVVLTEGVGGPPSLSPTSLLVTWIFGNYSRACFLGELAPQSASLHEGPRAMSGDLSQAEFAAGSSCGTSLMQAVALPVLMVLVEPIHLGRWLLANGRAVAGGSLEDAAAFRHWMNSALGERDGDIAADVAAEIDGDEGLLPGVLERRNAHLLARLDDVLARPGIDHVALPWGAHHMPGIAAALRERGFARSSAEWLRAIAVRSLLDGSAPDPDLARSHVYLPYLLEVQHDRVGASYGLLCDAIAVRTTAAEPFGLDLLWGLVSRWQVGTESGESGFSLLPSLFGRPLLFDWRRRGEAQRVRVLWFFEFGE